ncbi:hypothetical protein BLS_008844 [Venturia inaequalis]|uniref:DUF3669 domain-containing protein n=1 Tax=Venturia inaequalis TaxID=5025 RepID=A0A8H3YNC8_VENIN|nr:hypothetical protein BLS_008844 [Venturia inaequalis]KAE9984148.1 hypothetical protein EG327_005229 [Venturia inaequalis]RDI82524.1 Peptide transporter [Venturia inaequalis]
MSRREQSRTDQSFTDSLRQLAITTLRYSGDLVGYDLYSYDDIKNAKPEAILHRMLSTKSYISTTSSNAVENQRAAEDVSQQAFKDIGSGQCGTVYALVGTSEVLKICKPGKEDVLFVDCQMHVAIEEAFKAAPLHLHRNIALTSAGEWAQPDNAVFWSSYLEYFPQNFQPTYGLVSSRIFPLPYPVRAALFDAFAPFDIQQNRTVELSKAESKDCLVRPYLGRRLGKFARPAFRFRNFPLHVDDMEQLKLDTHHYAKVMAQALAIMHWQAGVDANDVEFVFGSSPKVKGLPSAKEMASSNKDDAKFKGQDLDFTHRSVSIWLLDFNQCKKISKDGKDLKAMVNGFMFNDPYYPRPGSSDKKDAKLWDTFEKEYSSASQTLGYKSCAAEFLREVKSQYKKRSQGSSGLF